MVSLVAWVETEEEWIRGQIGTLDEATDGRLRVGCQTDMEKAFDYANYIELDPDRAGALVDRLHDRELLAVMAQAPFWPLAHALAEALVQRRRMTYKEAREVLDAVAAVGVPATTEAVAAGSRPGLWVRGRQQREPVPGGPRPSADIRVPS